MPNWLALTWENDRLLLLSANIHNGSATFERCATFSAAPSEKAETEEGVEPAPTRAESGPSIKQQFADYIQKNRLSKTETIVVLSRADVEVRSMLFPPVPVEELPDLVRFQATREFNGYDASAPLDFFITTKLDHVSRSTLFPALQVDSKTGRPAKGQAGPAGSPKHLLASTIRSTRFQKIQEQCEKWGLPLRHLLLRPCQSAYLWRHTPQFDPGRSVLLVELDASEMSQVVMFQGEPIFMRSPKISCPEDVAASDFAARLIAELKRTRIAARNEIQGVTIDEVVLCGVGTSYEALARQVSEAMDVTVTTFDPWAGLSRGGELRMGRSEAEIDRPERFASLLGALLQIAKGEPCDIDFCNPKKKPEPVGKRKLATGIIAVVVLALLAMGLIGFYTRSLLDEEVDKLSKRQKALEREAVAFREERAQLTAIETWQANKVNWFEQLDWLVRKAPEAQDMMVSKLTLDASRGGLMSLETVLRDSSVVSRLDEKLSDEQHLLRTVEQKEDRTTPPYTFRYNFAILLSRSAEAQAVELPVGTESPPPEDDKTDEAPEPDAVQDEEVAENGGKGDAA